MATCLPREPVYHYECSAGTFRLVYFLPPGVLKELADAGRISSDVLLDFPDGVDLGCTEADFQDFEEQYGWRPETDPDGLRRTFYALFSSTHAWKTFRGSGRIPAADLERHAGRVAGELEARGIATKLLPKKIRPSARERRKETLRRKKVRRALETLPVAGVDPKKDLRRQAFSQIAMQPDGDPAQVVFSRVHEKGRK